MRTPQLTEQYGQVERVSVARAILSSLSCATAGVRSNPRREKPAPPTSAPRRKFLRESSICASSDYIFQNRADCTPNFQKTIDPSAYPSQSYRNCRRSWLKIIHHRVTETERKLFIGFSSCGLFMVFSRSRCLRDSVVKCFLE